MGKISCEIQLLFLNLQKSKDNAAMCSPHAGNREQAFRYWGRLSWPRCPGILPGSGLFSFLNLGAEGRELNGGGASDEDVPLGVCVCVS